MTEKFADLLFANLLFEVGTEELPAKAVKQFPVLFRDALLAAFFEQGITYEEITTFATPRRIAILIHKVVTQQPERISERKGPAIAQAFTAEGNLTAAGEGFAKACNLDLKAMLALREECVDRLTYRIVQPGAATNTLLLSLIESSLKKAISGKTMRWGSHQEPFIRPVHWALLIFGNEKINGELYGQKLGNHTYGHRFLSAEKIAINNPENYKKIMEEHFVIANFDERKEKIKKELDRLAAEHNAKPLIEEDLLDEVTGLVEWPIALVGHFEESFLTVPQEALITSMKTNQKCFPLLDTNGKLLPMFIVISNIESKNAARVVEGNEKVVRARLSDAKFFFETDKKQPLIARLEQLKEIIFQAELGSLYDKTQRIKNLALLLVAQLNNVDATLVARAAELIKCDLTTAMVGEFPELQGIMGKYYAWHDKEPQEVSFAIEEHYLPRFSNDKLPETPVGQIVALADRIDTLLGLFGINKQPTGEKDPFALRRAAQGIVRICVENNLSFDLLAILKKAILLFSDKKLINVNTVDQVWQFISERQRAWYVDQGITADLYNAVFATQCANLTEFDQRVLAVKQFVTLPEAASLAAANKRVANLLQKQDPTENFDQEIQVPLLQVPSEIKLAEALREKELIVKPLYEQGNFTQALKELAQLQKIIDEFFDNVMVMVDDYELRTNRLRLLHKARTLFLQVADISVLGG